MQGKRLQIDTHKCTLNQGENVKCKYGRKFVNVNDVVCMKEICLKKKCISVEDISVYLKTYKRMIYRHKRGDK